MSEDHFKARDVAEHLLKVTGEAMFEEDFDKFASCFEVPTELETFDGRRTISTIEALEEVFNSVRTSYRKLGVTESVRNCVEAEFKSSDVLVTTHVSRLLSGTTLIKKPYPVFSVLRRREGAWRIIRSQYAIVDAQELSEALCPSEPG